MDSEKTFYQDVYDMAIIGSGPAGMTAGLYGARAGLSVVMFESMIAGGQLGSTAHVDNYPGFPEGVNGFELASAMKQQCDRFGVESIGEEVTSVSFTAEEKTIATALGEYRAKTVIVASGARPRKLGLEGEEQLQGRGLSYCATCDGNFFKDQEVMVVGGGNTAAMDAIYLARMCKKVYLVHRRDRLRATAIYHKTIEDLPNVEPLWFTVPSKLLTQEGKLTGVQVQHTKTGETKDIECAGVFVAIGTQANTGFIGGSLELNDAGYLVADETGATSVPGVYVAGDVRAKALRQVTTAVADGANAAEMAVEFLMA